jgi:hypothetical protein
MGDSETGEGQAAVLTKEEKLALLDEAQEHIAAVHSLCAKVKGINAGRTCAECGESDFGDERGWRLHRTDEGELVYYCPACWALKFGDATQTWDEEMWATLDAKTDEEVAEILLGVNSLLISNARQLRITEPAFWRCVRTERVAFSVLGSRHFPAAFGEALKSIYADEDEAAD